MGIREKSMGRIVRFLLPSLKLKQAGEPGRTVEEDVHSFLVEQFGGYTASAGNLFGYWKDQSGKDSYGEHREFTVSFTEDTKLDTLRQFLASAFRTPSGRVSLR